MCQLLKLIRCAAHPTKITLGCPIDFGRMCIPFWQDVQAVFVGRVARPFPRYANEAASPLHSPLHKNTHHCCEQSFFHSPFTRFRLTEIAAPQLSCFFTREPRALSQPVGWRRCSDAPAPESIPRAAQPASVCSALRHPHSDGALPHSGGLTFESCVTNAILTLHQTLSTRLSASDGGKLNAVFLIVSFSCMLTFCASVFSAGSFRSCHDGG